MYRLLISCGLASLSMTYKLDFPSSINTLLGSGTVEDVIPYRQAFSPSSVRRFSQNAETYQIEQKNIPQPLKDNPEAYWLVNSSPLFRNARNWHLNVEKNIQQEQSYLREDGYWNLLRKELYKPVKSYIDWTENYLQKQNRTPVTLMTGLINQIEKTSNHKATSQPILQSVATQQIQFQINQNQMPELELTADLGDGSGAVILQNLRGQSN